MRGQAMALAVAVAGAAAPAGAQSGEASATRPTAEQMIETAREAYSVIERERPACPEPDGNEIVICQELVDAEEQSVSSPTERAYEAGEMPPDRIPNAPYVLGLPQCGVEVTCHRVGRAPPPIYIIDLSKIPEPLSPEEAARVGRAEDLPSPAAASPAAPP